MKNKKLKRLSRVRSTPSWLSQCKGSHVGIVLSFVIFITFTFFIYVLLQPQITSSTKKNLAEYVEDKIIENISDELTSISVRITNQNPEDCVQLINFLNEAGAGNNLKAVKNDVEPLTISINGNDLFVERDSSLFFRISESSEIESADSGEITPCQEINKGSSGYDLGLIKTDSYIFESKISRLMNYYASDYEGLKNQFNLASNNNFGFTLIYNDGTEKSSEEKTATLDVYVKEVPIIYVNSNGGIESGSLIIKVW